MITICRVNSQGYFMESLEIPDTSPIPDDWIVAERPHDTTGHVKWFSGQWIVVDDYLDIQYVKRERPVQISRIDFSRLFTGLQQARINALRKAVADLTVSDYSDPSKGLLIQLEIVFQQFDLPLEYIELNHEDTRLGLELLGYAGIFGEDPVLTEQEINRIIKGDTP